MWALLGSRKKLEARKPPENAQNPSRPLHAVLGAGFKAIQAIDNSHDLQV